MKRKPLWVNTYKYTEIICKDGEQEHPERNEKDRAYYYLDVLFDTGAKRTYQINRSKTSEWDNVPKDVMRWIHSSITKCYECKSNKETRNNKCTYRIRTTYKQF